MVVPTPQRLKQSKFRASFRLKDKDLEYARTRDPEILRQHAFDFLRKRLMPKNPAKDGKQTPFKGHPVFVAQHATATCCRSCLSKWYKIPKGRALQEEEVITLVDVISCWIEKNTQTG